MDYNDDKKKNEHGQNQDGNTTKVMDEQKDETQKKDKNSEADKIGKFDA